MTSLTGDSEMSRPADQMPAWVITLVRDFSPKVVPLDVTPEGTYEESTTRWGLHPTYAAVPEDLRDQVESQLGDYPQAELKRLR